MKKNLAFNFLVLLLFALNSNAQQNARPQAVVMTLQIGGSGLGGPLIISNLIPVLAWSEGISSGCITPTGCPTPNQQDISMTMYQKSHFITLRKALLTHMPINLELVSTATNGDVTKIYLEDAFVSSISNGGSGGEDTHTMNITFTAQKWDHEYDIIGIGGRSSYGWNFTNNLPFSHY